MKAYKVELLIVDHDEIGPDEIKHWLEKTKYPNHCMNPTVMLMATANIGRWHDNHPLNKLDSMQAEYLRLFPS